MKTVNKALNDWVEETARLTQPQHVHWCDGSEEEYRELIRGMLADGTLEQLNPNTHPDCYLHRSHPSDVARVEHLTYICTRDPEAAGPNNHWMAPDEAHEMLNKLFAGSMRGRTLYVVPYLMGPYGSPYSRGGVEITDSPYVAVSMRIMTRMGKRALEHLNADGRFVKGLHSTGDLDPNKRFIMHFPEELTIKSIGSGYGGNALLGKKCHALRIGSWQAREEGWLAEHMLILGLEDPSGRTTYIAAAFPSACGKTNLAMIQPPPSFKGWRVWTLGDDIAWLNLGPDGRLWAINPEAGFFGVAPGTSASTNANCMATLGRHTIYTNVAMTPDRQPWWEGLDGAQPAGLIDWQGRPYKTGDGPAAHPNSRFTVSASQCPTYSPRAEDPAGVPISAFVFGGRRAALVPLVYEAFDWDHGVFVGASVASETTAAAAGEVGRIRRDPMAMQPFCGYNFADYWAHWYRLGKRSTKLPRVYHVNWFRKSTQGKFLWPGFGENMRVLQWIVERCNGEADAVPTPIGNLPAVSALNLNGLKIEPGVVQELLAVNPELWKAEMAHVETYFSQYGDRLPSELRRQLERVRKKLLAQEAA
jgi:phosphoenolpyruvate carboxykinase (GTP)